MANVIDVPTVTLEGARKVAEAAIAAAAEKDAAVAVVVLNASGNVVLVHRMDAVVELALENATAKARAAITFKRSTGDLSDYFRQDDSLGPPMTARSSILAVEGGEPLRTADGTVVGALGISGSRHAIDQECASAGIRALLA